MWLLRGVLPGELELGWDSIRPEGHPCSHLALALDQLDSATYELLSWKKNPRTLTSSLPREMRFLVF